MDKLGVIYSLEGLAQVAAAMEIYERAAILWGAANRLRETMNIPLEPSRKTVYISLIPSTRSKLGEEAFERAWQHGRELTVQEAIKVALTLSNQQT
jgi:hypothetical protein